MNTYKVFYEKDGNKLCRTVHAWSEDGAIQQINDLYVVIRDIWMIAVDEIDNVTNNYNEQNMQLLTIKKLSEMTASELTIHLTEVQKYMDIVKTFAREKSKERIVTKPR
jgi:6-phosphogluconate dehydrogenase